MMQLCMMMMQLCNNAINDDGIIHDDAIMHDDNDDDAMIHDAMIQ